MRWSYIRRRGLFFDGCALENQAVRPSGQLRGCNASPAYRALDESLTHKLTLVSAPAGFGKTTLLSEWIGGCGHPFAWLSLDEGDNDPISFLNYVVAALGSIDPDIGRGLVSLDQVE